MGACTVGLRGSFEIVLVVGLSVLQAFTRWEWWAFGASFGVCRFLKVRHLGFRVGAGGL